MPITKSAKKALRQNTKRRAQNTKTKTKFKVLSKKLATLVADKKSDEAKKILILATKAIDKAVKTGVLKPNTASRKKSRIARLVNSINA